MAQTEELGEDKGKRITPRIRHIPYHAKRTLGPAGTVTERIKTDKMIGLGTVGRAGYIYNDGPGGIEVQLFDGKIWSDWIPISSGDGINMYYEDNLWMEMIKIRTDRVFGATYELVMAPGLEEVGR